MKNQAVHGGGGLRSIHDPECHTQARGWPCGVLDNVAQTAEAVVEILLSRLKLLRRPASIPVTSDLVEGIVRFPFCFGSPLTDVFQVAVCFFEFHEGTVKTFPGVLQFTLCAFLMLLAFCKLIHRRTHDGEEQVSPQRCRPPSSHRLVRSWRIRLPDY